jgi:peptidoglycan/LPS O-acetylase OafA/YrhL
MDSILFGCILALWQNPLLDRDAWRPSPLHVLLALATLLVTFLLRDELFRQTIRYSLHGAALFVLFSYVLAEGSKLLQKVLTSPPMIWIGLVSYSLYLCHFAIFQALTINTQLGAAAVGVTGTLLSLGYAFLMRKYVELPILTWRRKRSAAKRDALARIADKSAGDELAQAATTLPS